MRSCSVRILFLFCSALVASVFCSQSQSQDHGSKPRVRYNVMVPMRDGVRLATDIYFPEGPGPFPVILERDPYSNGTEGNYYLEKGQFWASHGYCFLHQDVRGRHDSEGAWYAFMNEAADGYDAIHWAGQQPWSNGKVATVGGSYMAFDQWQAASMQSPYLQSMIPMFSPLDIYGDMHPGGAFEITRIVWTLRMNGHTSQNFQYDWADALLHTPLITMDRTLGQQSPVWQDWVSHESYGPYWEPLDMKRRLVAVDVPVFHIGGWFDTFLRSTLAAYTGMASQSKGRARSQKLVIGPWPHTGNPGRKAGEVDFGPAAQIDLNRLQLSWMEHTVKGLDNEVPTEDPIRIFVMGENRWRSESEWPLARTRYERLYLHSNGAANTLSGDGSLSRSLPAKEIPDQFTYDPKKPVPTTGGSLPGSNPGMESGPHDQTKIEQRNDVLVYTTEPLQEDLEVTGPLSMTLYAASSAPDTDFTAKLVDVYPDGRAIGLVDSIIRARYRNSRTEPELIEPGKIYGYEIDLVATSNVFKKGHRIRIEISSSNFPRFSRNFNTGNPVATDTELRVADQTIHHDSQYPSHITLPVIPNK